MSTISTSGITSSNTTFNLTKASMTLQVEMFGYGKNSPTDAFFNTLKAAGVINYEQELTRSAGDTVNLYNMPRLDMLPTRGDADHYAEAQEAQYGDRSIKIALLSGTIRYPKNGTFRQQLVDFNLSDNVPQQLTQWMKSTMVYAMLNQLAGNTVTTIDAPRVYSSGITTSSNKLSLTGNSAAIAPSSRYKAYGSSGAGSVSDDQSVTSSNELRWQDIMEARETIKSIGSGIPAWGCVDRVIRGYYIDAVLLVSTTGMNQLKNDPVTEGQGINFAQTHYSLLAGGKDGLDAMKGFVLDHILVIEMPDDFFPRGVHSSTSAEVANTRRAVLVGANALDVAAGKGYAMENGGYVPGFDVEIDDAYKPLNDEGYARISWNGGCKKTQLKGTGSNASTAYDLATYVITHYSAN